MSFAQGGVSLDEGSVAELLRYFLLAMRLIGLTGGIASGKSTVSGILKEKGFRIVDLDELARIVVKKGSRGLRQIKETFGEQYIQSDGELDRRKMGGLVFSNPDARRKLNGITHPLIRRELYKLIFLEFIRGTQVLIIDAPLLFEAGLHKFMGRNVVVYVEPQVQLARLMKRDNITAEEANTKIAAQMPLKEKAARAHEVIDNSADLTSLRTRVDQFAERIRPKWTLFTARNIVAVVLFAPLAYLLWLNIPLRRYVNK